MGSTPIHPNCYITNNDVNFINKFQSAVCEIRFQMPKFIKLEVIEIWTSNLDSGFFAYSLTDIFQIYPISLSLSLSCSHVAAAHAKFVLSFSHVRMLDSHKNFQRKNGIEFKLLQLHLDSTTFGCLYIFHTLVSQNHCHNL